MSEVEKNQWCEIGKHVCEKTDPCSFDDAGKEFKLLQVCPKCRHAFSSTKIYWGSHPWQYFWRLISPISRRKTKETGRPYYVNNLTKEDVLRLRAAGYVVVPEEVFPE